MGDNISVDPVDNYTYAWATTSPKFFWSETTKNRLVLWKPPTAFLSSFIHLATGSFTASRLPQAPVCSLSGCPDAAPKLEVCSLLEPHQQPQVIR